MTAMSAWAPTRRNRFRGLLTAFGAVVILAGFWIFGAWTYSDIQPGGPACTAENPCTNTGAMPQSTSLLELAFAIILVICGAGLIVVPRVRPMTRPR